MRGVWNFTLISPPSGGGYTVGSLSNFFTRLLGKNSEPPSPNEELKMAKVLVLYHSMYGHIETVI